MSSVKSQVEDKIDSAADATKNAAGKVIDKSKDVAHTVGKKIEEGGKDLKKA